MRWAVGLTFFGVFALYYGLADSLPRGSGVVHYDEPLDIEGSESTAPQEIARRTPDNRPFPEDPSYASARAVVLSVAGNRFTAGAGSANGFEVGLEVQVFRGRNPASDDQTVGLGVVVACSPATIDVELKSGRVARNDFVLSEKLDLSRDVYLPRATHTARPAPSPSNEQQVDVTLNALVEEPARELVSFAVPFAPGELRDLRQISVWHAGRELPTAVKSLGPWRMDGQPGTPRAVLVQFELDFAEPRQSVTVRWDRTSAVPRRELVAVAKTLVVKTHVTKVHERLTAVEYEEPRVLATLPAEWLCRTWVAGPQLPTARSTRLRGFEQTLREAWHAPEAGVRGDANLSGDYAEQQLDRTVLLYRHYARTGDSLSARDAYRHATFYRRQITTAEESKRGRGAFKLKHTREDLETAWLDVKYAYAEGLAVHYWLTGDERVLATLEDLCAFWDSEFGDFIRNDYSVKPAGWTERFAAFAWLNWLHAWQVTGNPHARERAEEQCHNVYRMQFHPGDGHKPDGSWRHSSDHHGEGGDSLGSSVWMSALLVDAVFQHWLTTGDERCPHMLTAYAEFAERYGVHWFSWAEQTSDTTSLVPRWPQPWYWASAVHGGQSDTGGESDHNIETGYVFALGYYFRRDPRYLYWARELMEFQPARIHPRLLNWSFRASPQAAWLLEEAE
jgi:hypothetical protein